MPLVTFALLREGPSDEGLVPHLQTLLVREGAEEVIGSARDYTGPVADKLSALLREETSVDLVFIHRDPDGPSADSRYEEIRQATEATGYEGPCVAVIPIQELEAWLLISEPEIRRVVGKPSGRVPLNLPKLSEIEGTHDPKAVLKTACLLASETTGRRREREKRAFGARRRTLLERLDIDGPVRQLTSWQKLEKDISAALARLVASRQQHGGSQ